MALIAVVLVGMAVGGEWQTTRGEYCIDECKYRDDNNFFYWCHTVDGVSKVYRPDKDGRGWSSDWDHSGDDLDWGKRWDYCTPGQKFEEEGNGGRSRNRGGVEGFFGNVNNAWINEKGHVGGGMCYCV